MNYKIPASFLLLLIFMMTSFTEHSKKIEKKLHKEITTYFNIEEFTTEVIEVSETNLLLVKSEFKNDNLLKIISKDAFLGYAYIGNAPSKTATFDYLVILDKDFTIAKAKVLTYREEYGGEIGSKRWLKQFIGKSKKEEVKFPEEIDAISGATISVRSMTIAVGNLLSSIQILHQNKVI